MTKRSLAALAASILMSVAAIDGFVAPQLAHAQASGAAGTSAQAAAPSAAPAPAAEPAPPPAPATTEAVENPYGLGALWKNGDFVARFVLILLVIMSMGSWYIMITKFLEQLRANRRAKLADAQLWTAPSLAEGAKLLDEASPFGSSPKRRSRPASIMKTRCWKRWTATRGSTCRSSARSRTCRTGCRTSRVPGHGAHRAVRRLFGTVWGSITR